METPKSKAHIIPIVGKHGVSEKDKGIFKYDQQGRKIRRWWLDQKTEVLKNKRLISIIREILTSHDTQGIVSPEQILQLTYWGDEVLELEDSPSLLSED